MSPILKELLIEELNCCYIVGDIMETYRLIQERIKELLNENQADPDK